jgi:hypothetical protein
MGEGHNRVNWGVRRKGLTNEQLTYFALTRRRQQKTGNLGIGYRLGFGGSEEN